MPQVKPQTKVTKNYVLSYRIISDNKIGVTIETHNNGAKYNLLWDTSKQELLTELKSFVNCKFNSRHTHITIDDHRNTSIRVFSDCYNGLIDLLDGTHETLNFTNYKLRG